ncbi:MAG: Uma2 family endonuclease [Minicystis sp.]
MVEPARKLSYTFAEYLAIDEGSEVRHEYVNGEVFAMSGGTLEHSQIAANLISTLSAQLRGRPCVVYTSDARVRVRATGLATYPDVTVVCGAIERDPENKHTITNPVVLVEVLSDSTEGYDREEKFSHYRRIPSLREYLLVSQHEQRIEHLSRNDDGSWTLRDVTPPEIVRIPSIGCELSLAEVYRDPLAAPG